MATKLSTWTSLISTANWAAPLKLHTSPVEDFGQVYRMGSGNFQMHPPFEGYLYYSSQREYISCSEGPNKLFKLKFTLPRGFLNLPQGMYGIQMELPILLIE